jgi:hypothetical protein
MKSFLYFLSLIVFVIGCNSGESKDSQKNITKTEVVKSGVIEAQSSAPWKDKVTINPNCNQIESAKRKIDGLSQIILTNVVTSGKKNKTDVTEETLQGPKSGYVTVCAQ